MPNKNLAIVKFCRVCGAEDSRVVLNLEATPPGDIFFSSRSGATGAQKYPLTLAICEKCGYLHLNEVLDPHISYSNYVYHSSITVGLRSKFEELADLTVSLASLTSEDLVVDLGSNDGTMLKVLRERGLRAVGVEPSERLAEGSRKDGLTVINRFFDQSCSEEIIEQFGQASVVIASYMFANIDDLQPFTAAVKNLLREDGIFVVQTGYHPSQFKHMMFDYIYHEHFSYFSASTISRLLSRAGLSVFHLEANAAKGGSLRVFAQPATSQRQVNHTIESFIQEEKLNHVEKVEFYTEFGLMLESRKKEIRKFLAPIQLRCEKIVGYGASHSTTTLLHHFELGDYLEFIVDDNQIKQGLYSPGFGLEVKSPESLYIDPPNVVLILAWQHALSIVERNRELLNCGVTFVTPLPELHILRSEDDLHFLHGMFQAN